MKTLVVYYSKTGNTRRLAEEIARELCCDIDEIRDKKERSGVTGWFSGSRDAFRKFLTDIEFARDPSEYDLVIVGSPIWSFGIAPAVRTYFTRNIEKFNNVAFFLSGTGLGIKGAFKNMEALSKAPVASFEFHSSGIETRIDTDRINEFCDLLR
ncbi:MAG: flavodoxin [Candidatus Altiarchaeia archaeon]|jgi:flavodoxin